MGEIIIAVRFIEEDNMSSLRSSRCGISWIQDGDLKSVVFKPVKSSYSVPVLDIDMEQFRTVISHVFVERWVKVQGIKVPYEIWRSHFDVWPAKNDPPFAYVPPVYEFTSGKEVIRHAIEHVGGPCYITAEFISMELSSGSIPEAQCNVDLIPERLKYADNSDFLYHPGLYPGDLGILGQYEDILIRTRDPRPTFVM